MFWRGADLASSEGGVQVFHGGGGGGGVVHEASLLAGILEFRDFAESSKNRGIQFKSRNFNFDKYNLKTLAVVKR